MARSEAGSRSDRRPAEPGRHYSRAFGIGIDAGFAIPRLTRTGALHAGPTTTLDAVPAATVRREWPTHGVETLLERPLPSGRRGLVVERHAAAGFHVWASRHGRHLLSPGGEHVLSALSAGPAWRWERLLFAQVLPLAAALGGRHPFHMSAVAIAGSAIAFSGPSGVGKSSIAAHLVAGGVATLVTDDVLSVDADDEVVAHPGPSFAGVDERELAAMSPSGRERLGPRIGLEDKVWMHAPVVPEPMPLRAVYFVVPGTGDAGSIRVTELAAPLLLGSAFLAYLRDPASLARHLDVCARVAREVPAFEVPVAAGSGAANVARRIEDHALELLQ